MKTQLIKTVLAAALFAAPLFAAPSAALAQASAGSVPNAFATPAPAPAPAPASVEGQAPDIARAEAALRSVIAAVQGAGFDYSVFTPDLATRMRQLSPEISPLIKSFGAVRTVEFQKAEGDAQLFRITFDNKVTEWMILFDPEDRIAALRFRPVEG
ncbi:hypothetical protein [Brevundimonas sp. SL130]|uniref:hypothetical protein n=1 Tax=Brevundimonas sp. SL130 TaxID=2995143 RepID=UPI00226D295A|nr:hypothetical protein [Brevundimonas sp. SL130]WAC59931.1 hypothetical protein OU998_00365 [Brevundimonas sp. SL130]